MTRVLFSLALFVVLSISGCIAIGGKSETNPPTLGKQLIDLKVAYDQGAITEDEYEQAKNQLIYYSPSVARGD